MQRLRVSLIMSVATVFDQATCRFQFQAFTGVFVDFAGQAQRQTGFQATTLPRLGLVDDFSREDGLPLSILAPRFDSKPWDRFQAYVANLNEQDPGRMNYKVLYITRHGLGFHNAFMSTVSRHAWNVCLAATMSVRSLIELEPLVTPRRRWRNRLGGFAAQQRWRRTSKVIGSLLVRRRCRRESRLSRNHLHEPVGSMLGDDPPRFWQRNRDAKQASESHRQRVTPRTPHGSHL